MTRLDKISAFILFIFLLFYTDLIAQENNIADEKKIQSLIQIFYDNDLWENGRAIDALVEIGEPSVNFLIKSLQEDDENIRWCSAIALEKIAPSGKQATLWLSSRRA